MDDQGADPVVNTKYYRAVASYDTIRAGDYLSIPGEMDLDPIDKAALAGGKLVEVEDPFG